METDGVLRHLAFFEELGRMDESDASWRSVSAGLVVMRLVDQWIADGPRAMRADSWSVSAVREAIAQVAETTPIKRILGSVVDAMTSCDSTDLHMLCPRLMAYGQALEYEAKWTLAADIYSTIAAHAHPVDDADLATAAHLQLAFCLRSVGDLDTALGAYHCASGIALKANDLLGVLRARLGEAKIAAARGNLPHADAILVETVECARTNGLNQLRSQALGDRAWVASMSNQWDRSVRYAYEALEFVQAQRTKDRILNNIANGFRHLGLVDAARDSYLVLAATAEEQYIRWMAELNLMEIAAQQGMELQFDRYRRDLESADFTPDLRFTYYLHAGRGYHMLGNSRTGIPYLQRAVDLAATHGLNQMIFEAEEALLAAQRERPAASTPIVEITPDIKTVVDAMHDLKDMAGVT